MFSEADKKNVQDFQKGRAGPTPTQMTWAGNLETPDGRREGGEEACTSTGQVDPGEGGPGSKWAPLWNRVTR